MATVTLTLTDSELPEDADEDEVAFRMVLASDPEFPPTSEGATAAQLAAHFAARMLAEMGRIHDA